MSHEAPNTPTVYLARLAAEVMIKSRPVRARFQRRLARNIEDALRSVGAEGTVRNDWSRMFVQTSSGEAARDVLCRVFGLHSLSPIERRSPVDLEEIVRAGAEAYRERVRGKTFAVRTHRAGKQFPFKSLDVNVRLGAELDRDGNARVDLDNPQVTVHVEVRPDETYFFCEELPGARGLPLGTQQRAVALVSGGFDSVVAAWFALRRGVELDYLLCNLAGPAFERQTLSVVKPLADGWSYGSKPRLSVVDFQPLVESLRRDVDPKYIQVVLKRLMYRAAARLAEQIGAQAIVTGESLGQVSSQTLANLRAIEEATALPVLRPLIGMDKEDIIAHTRRLGVFDLAAKVQEFCAVTPEKPITSARPEAARAEEARLDLGAVNRAVEDRKTIELRSLSRGDLVAPYLYVEEVPPGAVVIDCRPPLQYQAWHWPEARNIVLADLLEGFRELEPKARYVLYCPFGTETAVAAERMQRHGYMAYSFRGGSQALRKHAQRRGLED